MSSSLQIPTTVQFSSAANLLSRIPEPAPGSERKAIAVLTSGGDSQGMNAAVRAVVRVALYNHCDAYAVHEGYQGLVDGGSYIKKMSWGDVAGILTQGGTVIGTARCKAFRERSGRLRACKNLVHLGINNLLVIGGDGSLTGADMFKSEWSSLVKELVDSGEVSSELGLKYSFLNVVGMVGSIDNDMCGTEMTIGADTALKRILEAIDSIVSTASSHQRSFVLEVMGRNCGYLALMASIASGADWTFIPEFPFEEGWESAMCAELKHNRDMGRRSSLVIVSEGARDQNGKPITSNQVKEVIERALDHDTRVTVLGHVQRGGSPTVYDRLLGTTQGARAVYYFLQNTGEAPPVFVGIRGTKLINVPLMEAVKQTQSVGKAMACKDFQQALQLRGGSFSDDYDLLRQLNSSISTCKFKGKRPYKIALMCTGAPAAGMNIACRAAVCAALDAGHSVYGVANGFDGLAQDDMKILTWLAVNSWGDKGGCILGTNRSQPTGRFTQIAATLKRRKIDAILMIGGFEAYTGLLELVRHRKEYPEFAIPMICLPATISNNIPGTEFSVGSDTALNAIVNCIDIIKQSATSTRARVFIVETHGGYCGYLATVSALAAGAERAYTHEEGITLEILQNDLHHFIRRFNEGATCAVILRNEKANSAYTTEFIESLFTEEGKGLFACRSNVLGHLQQGLAPSPLDRIRGVKLAVRCVRFLVESCDAHLNTEGQVHTEDSATAAMIGLRDVGVHITPLLDLVRETDFALRVPKVQWWREQAQLLKVFAKYNYHGEDVGPLID